MHRLLIEYFTKKGQEEEKERNEVLISEGLYVKRYSEKTGYSNEYPYSEWDENRKEMRYFKKVPIYVTDEEYEHILRARQKSKSANKTNMVANTLAAMAWIIFIVGFIVGIVSGTEEFKDIYGETLDTKFEFMVALKYWIEYFIYGILVLALAEIIKLLHSINNKIK